MGSDFLVLLKYRGKGQLRKWPITPSSKGQNKNKWILRRRLVQLQRLDLFFFFFLFCFGSTLGYAFFNYSCL